MNQMLFLYALKELKEKYPEMELHTDYLHSHAQEVCDCLKYDLSLPELDDWMRFNDLSKATYSYPVFQETMIQFKKETSKDIHEIAFDNTSMIERLKEIADDVIQTRRNIMNRKWTYKEIENLTEKDVKEFALESMDIKGYNCYFVDFEGDYGYSAMVFKNGHNISEHMHLYQMHSRIENHDELKKNYIHRLNNILFTDKELMEPVQSYNDHERKMYFIRNYLPKEYDNLTMFCINGKYTNPKDIAKEKSGKYVYRSDIACAFFKDNSFNERAIPLLEHVEQSYEELKMDPEVFREAVASGLANHETGYTGDFKEGLESVGYTFDELDDEHKMIVLEEFVELLDYVDNKKKELERLKGFYGLNEKSR